MYIRIYFVHALVTIDIYGYSFIIFPDMAFDIHQSNVWSEHTFETCFKPSVIPYTAFCIFSGMNIGHDCKAP